MLNAPIPAEMGVPSISESARTSRLEHIISQSVKRSLEAERKNEMEMHVLDLKLQATQAMCERLEKTLQVNLLRTFLLMLVPKLPCSVSLLLSSSNLLRMVHFMARV